jgi:hypothetical protein
MRKCSQCGSEKMNELDRCANCGFSENLSGRGQPQGANVSRNSVETLELVAIPYRNRQLLEIVKGTTDNSAEIHVEWVNILTGVATVAAFGLAGLAAASLMPKVSGKLDQLVDRLGGHFNNAMSAVPGIKNIRKGLESVGKIVDEATEEMVEVLPARGQINDFLDAKANKLRAYFEKRTPDNLLRIPADFADKLLCFQAGHPLYGTVYVGHPLVPRVYVTVASFHRYLFEDKFNELLTLLYSLGARQLEIHHVRGYSTAVHGKDGISLPGVSDLEVTASSSRQFSQSSEGHLTAQFSPIGEPRIPQSLVWLSYEQTWKNLAEARLTHGLKEIDVELQYNDDYGINKELTIKLIKLGLSLGGSFEGHEHTTWKLKATFS